MFKSKRSAAMTATFSLGLTATLIMGLAYVAWSFQEPARINASMGYIFPVAWIPFVVTALVVGVMEVDFRIRSPDVVITVTERPPPLAARFLEQDRRLERREQLKKQMSDLDAEIETFNTELSPDGRKAWLNRPGPYGK